MFGSLAFHIQSRPTWVVLRVMGIGPNPGDISVTAAAHREGGRYRLVTLAS